MTMGAIHAGLQYFGIMCKLKAAKYHGKNWNEPENLVVSRKSYGLY
jgi:hypothetical protein